MSSSSFIPRKNLFTVHSGITVLMMQLIIRHYKLDPNTVYVASRGSCLQSVLDLNLVPRQNIINSDHIYQYLEQTRMSLLQNITYTQFYEKFYLYCKYALNIVLTLLDDNIDPQLKVKTDCLLQRDYFAKIDFDAIYKGEATQLYEPYEQIKADDPNLDFNLFTQHCSDPFFNTLVQSKHCRCVKYCEEGSMNYLNYDESMSPIEKECFEVVEDNISQYKYEYLGIKRLAFSHLFRFDEVGNPNLDLERSGFIGLSSISFRNNFIDHKWKNNKVNLEIIDQASAHNISKQDNPFYVKQQEIYKNTPAIANSVEVQTALKNPNFIANYVNIIICENQVDTRVSVEEFYEAHTKLINEVINKGVFFFYIKFHPLCRPEVRQLLIDYIQNHSSAICKIIDDNVCLEQIFSDSQAHTFIVHTIASSVGIYASKLLQLTFTYDHLYEHIPFYQQLKYQNHYDLAALVNFFYQENQAELEKLAN